MAHDNPSAGLAELTDDGWPMPVLLSENPLLNNRAIALICDRSREEIDVADAGAVGGYVYEKSKARLTFFNESTPSLIADLLAHWPNSKQVIELEVPEVPSPDLVVQLFGRQYDVSRMQILSFKTFRSRHTASVSTKVDVASSQVVELVQGFHRDALHSSISVDRAEALINGSSRDFFASHVDGRFVAVAALTRKVGRARCLSFFYVDPRYRKQGFGEAIFAHTLAEGLRSSEQVFLHVDCSNLPAIGLYAKFAPADIGSYVTVKATPLPKDSK